MNFGHTLTDIPRYDHFVILTIWWMPHRHWHRCPQSLLSPLCVCECLLVYHVFSTLRDIPEISLRASLKGHRLEKSKVDVRMSITITVQESSTACLTTSSRWAASLIPGTSPCVWRSHFLKIQTFGAKNRLFPDFFGGKVRIQTRVWKSGPSSGHWKSDWNIMINT